MSKGKRKKPRLTRIRARAPEAAERRALTVPVVGALTLFFASAGIILALYFAPDPDLLFGDPERPPDFDKLAHVEMSDGIHEILSPHAYVRNIRRSFLGPVEQVDLRVPWPFEPYTVNTGENAERFDRALDISFDHRLSASTQEERLEMIYPAYVEGQPEVLESGLTRHRFYPDSAYGGFSAYAGEIDGEPIVFLCANGDTTYGPQLCERQIVIGDSLVARYRFHHTHVRDWQSIERTARALIEQFVMRKARS